MGLPLHAEGDHDPKGFLVVTLIPKLCPFLLEDTQSCSTNSVP